MTIITKEQNAIFVYVQHLAGVVNYNDIYKSVASTKTRQNAPEENPHLIILAVQLKSMGLSPVVSLSCVSGRLSVYSQLGVERILLLPPIAPPPCCPIAVNDAVPYFTFPRLSNYCASFLPGCTIGSHLPRC